MVPGPIIPLSVIERMDALHARLETKVDEVREQVISLRVDLATHKARTSFVAMGGAGVVTALVYIIIQVFGG